MPGDSQLLKSLRRGIPAPRPAQVTEHAQSQISRLGGEIWTLLDRMRFGNHTQATHTTAVLHHSMVQNGHPSSPGDLTEAPHRASTQSEDQNLGPRSHLTGNVTSQWAVIIRGDT